MRIIVTQTTTDKFRTFSILFNVDFTKYTINNITDTALLNSLSRTNIQWGMIQRTNATTNSFYQ